MVVIVVFLFLVILLVFFVSLCFFVVLFVWGTLELLSGSSFSVITFVANKNDKIFSFILVAFCLSPFVPTQIYS